jgi:hypothetical protein
MDQANIKLQNFEFEFEVSGSNEKHTLKKKMARTNPTHTTQSKYG